MYSIKPLEWEGELTDEEGSGIRASVPMGSYTVGRRYGDFGLEWGYCFDEYYDEDRTSCDTVEEGMAAAEKNWRERIARALEPTASHSAALMLAGYAECIQASRDAETKGVGHIYAVCGKHGYTGGPWMKELQPFLDDLRTKALAAWKEQVKA